MEPIQFPPGPLSELLGKVYPYPPSIISIAHAEHWHEHWYDLQGLFLYAYNLIQRVSPFDLPMVLFFLALALGVPLLFSLSSIRRRRPQVGLSVGLGLWFAVFMGNKVEVWLFGHVTDWIWFRFGSYFSLFTNLADVMALVALVTLLFWQGSKDTKR